MGWQPCCCGTGCCGSSRTPLTLTFTVSTSAPCADFNTVTAAIPIGASPAWGSTSWTTFTTYTGPSGFHYLVQITCLSSGDFAVQWSALDRFDPNLDCQVSPAPMTLTPGTLSCDPFAGTWTSTLGADSGGFGGCACAGNTITVSIVGNY